MTAAAAACYRSSQNSLVTQVAICQLSSSHGGLKLTEYATDKTRVSDVDTVCSTLTSPRVQWTRGDVSVEQTQRSVPF